MRGTTLVVALQTYEKDLSALRPVIIELSTTKLNNAESLLGAIRECGEELIAAYPMKEVVIRPCFLELVTCIDTYGIVLSR